MIRKSPDDLQFVTLQHSEAPPQPQMAVAVRVSFRLVAGGPAERITDVLQSGYISGYAFEDGADPLTAAPLRPNDLTPTKPGAEVILTGTCHAPGGTPTPSCPVRVTVGDWQKELVVFGDRGWKPTAVGKQPTEPAPFTSMPLTWDRAFGGAGHPANPVGVPLDGDAVPNIEYPDQLITSGQGNPPTAGFAPLNPEWPLRSRLRGKNYGKEYNETRAPWFSDDFDADYFFSGPGDQRLDQPFTGTEEITLLNLHPEHEVLTTTLPGVRPRAFVNDRERNFRELDLAPDTIWIEADEQRVHLIWRGTTDVQDVDHADVDIIYVELVPLDDDKPAAEYEAVLDKWEADPAGVKDAVPEGFEEAAARFEEAQKAGTSPLDLADSAAGAGSNPLSQIVAAAHGPMAAGAQQEVADEIARVGQSDLAPMGANQDLNSAMSDAIAAADPPPPPPAVPATYGVRPRIPLSEQWAGVEEYKAQLAAAGVEPEQMAKVDELLANEQWAVNDPALAAKVNQVRAELGMPAVDTPEPPGGADLPTVAAALAAGAGAFALARIAAGLVSPPKMLPGGVPERPPELHGPMGPEFGKQKRQLVDEDLSNLDLHYEDFTDCNLYGANLSNSNLEGVSFRGANLEYANLYNANLAGADFTGANLYMATLESASAREAKLVDAFIETAVFTNARLAGANFKGAFGPYAQFPGARLTGAFGEGLRVPGGNFDKAVMTGASFKGADFTRASFNEVAGEHLDLTDATLTRLSAPGSKLAHAIFTCAVATDCNFVGTDLENADFTAATLHRSFFQDAKLRQAVFEWADLRNARLRKAVLDFARMGKANLHEADLGMASCVETSFANTNLFHTTLHEATLSNCDFTGANLHRALLRQSS